MRVVFPLGAGISFDLLPLSRQLTEIVQSGEAHNRVVLRSNDATYALADPALADDPVARQDVERVRSLPRPFAVISRRAYARRPDPRFVW
jgi:hypothetical protein